MVPPDRFFSLLIALQSCESTTTAELARELGVSVRTVLRDLRWLQEAGFPLLVRRGRWGGVALLPGGALDASRLAPAERDHLALEGLDDEQRDQLGTAVEARRARSKVAAVRRPPEQDALPLSAVVTTDNTPWFGPRPGGISPAELLGDLRRGVRLRIHYRRSEGAEPAWRAVDPYGLLAKGGRWYLVADRGGSPACTRSSASSSGGRCEHRAACARGRRCPASPRSSPSSGKLPPRCGSRPCSTPPNSTARSASSAAG
ncbi:hypothetical protein GCM10027174_34640 [Salinifilum aidingensis]